MTDPLKRLSETLGHLNIMSDINYAALICIGISHWIGDALLQTVSSVWLLISIVLMGSGIRYARKDLKVDDKSNGALS